MITDSQVSGIADICAGAGKQIMDIYRSGSFSITEKSDLSPVTEADLLSHRHITQQLNILFPDIPVISEESDLDSYQIRSSYDYVWLLDPLDGTREFIQKTDEFSINLALIHRGEAIAGFIYLPVKQSFHYALRGKGAWTQKEGSLQKLQVSTFSLRDNGLRVVASRSNPDPHTQSYIDVLQQPKIVHLGSALKFISIASGDSDYYPRMANIMEWDTAAGQILIEEAGGSMVDAQTGAPLRYNKPHMQNPCFIASGKIING